MPPTVVHIRKPPSTKSPNWTPSALSTSLSVPENPPPSLLAPTSLEVPTAGTGTAGGTLRKPPSTKSPNWIPAAPSASAISVPDTPPSVQTSGLDVLLGDPTPQVANPTRTGTAIELPLSRAAAHLKLVSPQRPPPAKPTPQQAEEKRSKRIRDAPDLPQEKVTASSPTREIFVAKRKNASPSSLAGEEPSRSSRLGGRDSPSARALPAIDHPDPISSSDESAAGSLSPIERRQDQKAITRPRGTRLSKASDLDLCPPLSPFPVKATTAVQSPAIREIDLGPKASARQHKSAVAIPATVDTLSFSSSPFTESASASSAPFSASSPTSSPASSFSCSFSCSSCSGSSPSSTPAIPPSPSDSPVSQLTEREQSERHFVPPVSVVTNSSPVSSLTESPVIVSDPDSVSPRPPSNKPSPTVASNNKESVSNFLKPTARSAVRRNALLGIKQESLSPKNDAPAPQTHRFFEDPESVKDHSFSPDKGIPCQSELMDQRTDSQKSETESAREAANLSRSEFERRGAIFGGDLREYGQHLQVQSPLPACSSPEDTAELVIHARSEGASEQNTKPAKKDRELSSFFANIEQVKQSSHTPAPGIHRETTTVDNRSEEQRSATQKAVQAAVDLPKREKQRRGALFGGDLRKPPSVVVGPSPQVLTPVSGEPSKSTETKVAEANLFVGGPLSPLSNLGELVLGANKASTVCLACGRVFPSLDARALHQSARGHAQRIA